MKVLCLWIALAVLVVNVKMISAAKLVVIREDSASKSEEESEERSNSEESKEIDLLLELLQEESRNRKPPPARTVKVIRRKPATEIITQQSVRKEKTQKPKLAKEYHVHYHNHQHQNPESPTLKFEEDKVRPVLWDSLSSHLNTFQDFYSLPKLEQAPLLSASDLDRFKNFKDFETLLESKDPFETNDKSPIRDHSMELPSGMDTFIPSTHSIKKPASKVNFELLKKYHTLLNSKYTPQYPPQYPRYPKQSTSGDDFPNRDRFAGFTDFSTIENPQPKSKPAEMEHTKGSQQDDHSIKDFAIVIKTKPRITHPKRDIQSTDHQPKYRKVTNGHSKSRYQQETRNVPKRPFRVPRILDSPGGAPKYIEKLNSMKYGSDNGHVNVPSRHNSQHNLNSIESQHRQMFQLRPFQRPNTSNHVYNGWVVQRLIRR